MAPPCWGTEEAQRIVSAATAVVEPGGMIFIHEFILDDTLNVLLFPALFPLNMLLNTPRGRSYSESQLKEMLKTAGVKNIGR